MTDKIVNSGWPKLIVASLLASLPSVIILAGILAVNVDRTNRVISDVRDLTAKGSDPVQLLATQVALNKLEQDLLKKSIERFDANQSMMINKLDQHLRETKPVSMTN
jgi:hypothetical protein